MRYTVRTSEIYVVGELWMPQRPGATTYTLTEQDVANIREDDGTITREGVALWLDSHAGDFAGIIDFRASLEDGDETREFDWSDEDNEIIYNGCMFPAEDDE
jgi:hypothetical protein